MEDKETPQQVENTTTNPNHYNIDILKNVGLDETFNTNMDKFVKELDENPPKDYKDEFDTMQKHFTKEEVTLIAVHMHTAYSMLTEQVMLMSQMLEARNSKKDSGLFIPDGSIH